MFPELLRERGYQTALLGKLHASGRSYERDKRHQHDGFDVYEYAMTPHDVRGDYNAYGAWLKENHPAFYAALKEKGRTVGHVPRECHFTHWAAERTMAFLKERDKDRPFFCMMSVVDPHDPYSDYPLEMRRRVDMTRDKAVIEDEGEDWPDEIRREQEHCYVGDVRQYTAEQIRQIREGYYASMALVDDEVGRVLATLEEEGLADDTLVVFCSDHGDMLGDHGLLIKGAFFYEASVRVPLLMRWPGRIEAGTRCGGLVQLHDVSATILAAAGIAQDEVTARMPDAIDPAAVVNGAAGRDYAVCMYRGTGIADDKQYFDPPAQATMYRDERHKLTVFHNGGRAEDELRGQLFDMEADPDERNNLWYDAGHAAAKTRLVGRLMDWFVQQDLLYHGSRGGEVFPDRSQWSLNNAL